MKREDSMRSSYVVAALFIIAGFVFMLLAFGGDARNNAYLALGVVFVVLGSARLRRVRRT